MSHFIRAFFIITFLGVVFTLDAISWGTKADMPTKRSDMTANTLGDEIIVVGGCTEDQICPPGPENFCFCTGITNSAESYSPKSNSWRSLPSMPRPRYRHAAVAVDSKLYVFGGRDLNDNLISEVDVYDSSTNSWSTLNRIYSWSSPTSDLAAVSVGSVIYAIGGYNVNYSSLSTVYTFDTAALIPQWKSTTVPNLHYGRGDHCAAVDENTIFVFGGFSEVNWCQALDTLESYDVGASEWKVRDKLHFPRGDSGCGMLHHRFHAVGGEQKDDPYNCSKYDVPIDHVESYHTEEHHWDDETSLPQHRFRFAASVWQDYVFIFGGQSSPVNESYPVLTSVLAFQDMTPTTVSEAHKLTWFYGMWFVLIVFLFN